MDEDVGGLGGANAAGARPTEELSRRAARRTGADAGRRRERGQSCRVTIEWVPKERGPEPDEVWVCVGPRRSPTKSVPTKTRRTNAASNSKEDSAPGAGADVEWAGGRVAVDVDAGGGAIAEGTAVVSTLPGSGEQRVDG